MKRAMPGHRLLSKRRAAEVAAAVEAALKSAPVRIMITATATEAERLLLAMVDARDFDADGFCRCGAFAQIPVAHMHKTDCPLITSRRYLASRGLLAPETP